jgi:hypothetical protein
MGLQEMQRWANKANVEGYDLGDHHESLETIVMRAQEEQKNKLRDIMKKAA